MQKLIEAFTIFGKYTSNDYCLSAEHDQIWIFVDSGELPVDSEDGNRLVELGWDVDTEVDNFWTKYV
jgi:hypothetical protein